MTIASEILDLLTTLLEPTPLTILLSVVIVVTIPILLHYILTTTSSSRHALPTILLLGPSQSGKTSLLTLFETGNAKTTLTSQTPLAVECSLPVSAATKTDSYRAEADPSRREEDRHRKFLLEDTPGHAKLRHHALSALKKRGDKNVRGVMFMVDAADLASTSSTASAPADQTGKGTANPSGGGGGARGGDDTLRLTAEYLHDILLLLSKQLDKLTEKKVVVNVLIAANKADLFTALPAPLVRSTLEQEIGRVRESLRVGLMSSGVDEAVAEEKGWLGGGEGEGEFRFEQLEEAGVTISVRGGSVFGGEEERNKEEGDVREWWAWIGDCL